MNDNYHNTECQVRRPELSTSHPERNVMYSERVSNSQTSSECNKAGRIEGKRQNPRVVFFGMCRLGMMIAVVAHLLLFAGAVDGVRGRSFRIRSVYAGAWPVVVAPNKSNELFRRIPEA